MSASAAIASWCLFFVAGLILARAYIRLRDEFPDMDPWRLAGFMAVGYATASLLMELNLW